MGIEIAAIFGAIYAWFGGHQLVGYLVFCMLIDFLTGLLAAAKERKINSSIATNGWIVKSAIMLAVGFAWVMEPLILERIGDYHMGEIVTLGFIAAQAISIVENLGRAGVPMPVWFRDLFVKLASQFANQPRPKA